MKEFFEYLKYLIDQSDKFGHVRLFNEQPDKTRNHQHRMTKKRSVYIELLVNETLTKELGINDYDMTIRCIIANDNKKFSKLEDIELIDELNGVLQNATNEVEGEYSFSSMVKIHQELDSDHDQISEPFLEYSTTLRDYSGYKYRNSTIGTLDNINITVEVNNG